MQYTYKNYEKSFERKKKLNILICTLVFILGISSVAVSTYYDMDGDLLSELRFMTVNGTLYTSVISMVAVVINFFEIRRGSELSSKKFYFIRLSSVVTEGVIALVIAMSFLPFIPDNPDILKFDSFNMHVIIPVLSAASFLTNDKPISGIKPHMHLRCVLPITLYAAVIITLIVLGLIPKENIPYSFMEVQTRPLWYTLLSGLIVYTCALTLSLLFCRWNRILFERRKKPHSQNKQPKTK